MTETVSRTDYDKQLARVRELENQLASVSTSGSVTPFLGDYSDTLSDQQERLNKIDDMKAEVLLVNSFANMSKNDRNLWLYNNKRKEVAKNRAEEQRAEKEFYQLRSFERFYKKDSLQKALRKLHRTSDLSNVEQRKVQANYDFYVVRQRQLDLQASKVNNYRYKL